ncbi:MAG: Lipopolysaccharide core heptosyltransferase RfaQ [bacterium ADurb.Bin478]|nr:MAG: Lipopolysaccharide core heptosyltransferase RfaQ [bacterium ADurb.Bin478]
MQGDDVHLWNRFEQTFKHQHLRWLEKWLGLPPLPMEQFDPALVRNILVVRQHDQLGDFLLSTPVFAALRTLFPGRPLTLVARENTAQLMRYDPNVDQVIPFAGNGRDWTLDALTALFSAVRNRFDLAVVLNTVSHSLTSDLIARLCCRRYIVGPEHLLFGGTSRNFFYNVTAPQPTAQRHQSERNLDIVRRIGLTGGDPHERIFITGEERAAAQRRWMGWGRDPRRPLVILHPGAGKLENRWPVASFAALANRLQETQSLQLAVSWGPAEEALGRELVAALHAPALIAVDKDLRRLAGLYSRAALFICNDTGVMHLAASVSTPLVAVFGPTDPALWKPWGDEFCAVRAEDHRCASVSVDSMYEICCNLLYNKELNK